MTLKFLSIITTSNENIIPIAETLQLLRFADLAEGSDLAEILEVKRLS